MSYQEELARLQEAKASMRQSIINKGVDVPENAKIETYPSYIAQILTGPPAPTGDGTLTDLKIALNYGNAATLYPVGTDIPDTYNSKEIKWRIVSYQDVKLPSGVTKPGVILYWVTTIMTSSKWASAADYQSDKLYGSSVIAKYLQDVYPELSEELRSVISESTIESTNMADLSNTESTNAKLFLPSSEELAGITGGSEEPWQYFKERIKPPTNESSLPRRINFPYWTRTYTAINNNILAGVSKVSMNGAIGTQSATDSAGVVPACAIVAD